MSVQGGRGNRSLTGSAACSSRGGATNVDAAGRRANYGCSASRTTLWGSPRRRPGTWRIRASRSSTPGPELLVAIRTAYIGQA
jgi:hypothetical protein